MGSTSPILNEELFWFGDDDGTNEADNTFLGIKNSNQTLLVNKNYRYRTSVSNTGDKDGNNVQLQLEYNLGGGGWNPVNAGSSVVRMAASTKLTEGNNCTERLAGAQTFDGTNGGQEDGDGLTGTLVDLAISNEFEADFCFTIISGDVVDTDSIVLRVTNVGTPLDNYNQIPTIIVSEPGGTTYEDALTLVRGQNTIVSIQNLDAFGALSLNKDMDVSFVSQLDAVEALSFEKDLSISLVGNIITPQGVVLGTKDLGLTLDGNVLYPESLTYGKDLGTSIVAGLAYATALALAKDAGLTISSDLTRVGSLALSKINGEAITSFLTRVGNINLSKTIAIAIDGNLVLSTAISLTKDIGIASSAQADFIAAVSLAKVVTFVPTHTFISGSGVQPPHIEGTVTLVEQAGGFVELIEQASGSIVLVETQTGIIILDLAA